MTWRDWLQLQRTVLELRIWRAAWLDPITTLYRVGVLSWDQFQRLAMARRRRT